MRRVGVLMAEPENDPESRARAAAFQEGLAKLGWIVGRNLTIDYRWPAGDLARTHGAAAELLHLAPVVIVAVATPGGLAARSATRTVPVVFVAVSDPVAQGFVPSLAHPGGNLTGFSMLEPTIGGKWLDLLEELAPGVKRVTVLFNPQTAPNGPLFFRSVVEAGQKHAVEAVTAHARNVAEVEAAVMELARAPGGGLIVVPDSFTTSNRKVIIDLAARYRVPATYAFRFFPADGGLVSYGVNVADLFRQGGRICRPHPSRRETRRAARAAADQIRSGDKPDHRQGAGPRCADDPARACRRGDRIAALFAALAHRRYCEIVKVFGCRPGPTTGGATRTQARAGVRKPPREETAMGRAVAGRGAMGI